MANDDKVTEVQSSLDLVRLRIPRCDAFKNLDLLVMGDKLEEGGRIVSAWIESNAAWFAFEAAWDRLARAWNAEYGA